MISLDARRVEALLAEKRHRLQVQRLKGVDAGMEADEYGVVVMPGGERGRKLAEFLSHGEGAL